MNIYRYTGSQTYSSVLSVIRLRLGTVTVGLAVWRGMENTSFFLLLLFSTFQPVWSLFQRFNLQGFQNSFAKLVPGAFRNEYFFNVLGHTVVSCLHVYMQNGHWQRKLSINNCRNAHRTPNWDAGFAPVGRYLQEEEDLHSKQCFLDFSNFEYCALVKLCNFFNIKLEALTHK